MTFNICSVTYSRVLSAPQSTAACLSAGCSLQAPVNASYRRRQPLRREARSPRGASGLVKWARSRHERALETCRDTTVEHKTVGTSVLATLFLFTLAWPAGSQAAAQHLHQPEAFQLATGDSDFWVNVSRYGRYFITVLLGTAYITVKPLIQLLKRPKTAIAVILGLVALYLFVSTTVQGMLGVSNPLEYQPSGFFPDNY